MYTALVTGSDRGLGLSMAKRLAENGWRVFAGSYIQEWSELQELSQKHPLQLTIVPMDIASDYSVREAEKHVSREVDRLDVIINNAAVSTHLKDTTIREKQDYNDLLRLYNVNAVGMLRVVERFLPLTERSELKRLCFVSSEAGSINQCHRKAWYGYSMSKAALNIGVSKLYGTLRPRGYSFRLFHPGWMQTYMSGLKNENAELHPDNVAEVALSYFINSEETEDRLVMKDWTGKEWPW